MTGLSSPKTIKKALKQSKEIKKGLDGMASTGGAEGLPRGIPIPIGQLDSSIPNEACSRIPMI